MGFFSLSLRKVHDSEICWEFVAIKGSEVGPIGVQVCVKNPKKNGEFDGKNGQLKHQTSLESQCFSLRSKTNTKKNGLVAGWLSHAFALLQTLTSCN